MKINRNGLWNNPRGENIYDSGAPFYNIYQCKDKKYLTVGAVERITYSKFIQVSKFLIILKFNEKKN